MGQDFRCEVLVFEMTILIDLEVVEEQTLTCLSLKSNSWSEMRKLHSHLRLKAYTVLKTISLTCRQQKRFLLLLVKRIKDISDVACRYLCSRGGRCLHKRRRVCIFLSRFPKIVYTRIFFFFICLLLTFHSSFFFFVSFKPILVGMLLKNERSKPKAV